ncbi:uncharacterized protein LOC119689775 [Teleopsis dalmanni]|uniref:uncharacterized protein LOC119689775 n=1 Tax=Teleopsis dalmanni TaxID=139649 RepID=UPI0018CED72E|nr:uncharacterized protein LOC119689775 [Teleopsis dalmanni]
MITQNSIVDHRHWDECLPEITLAINSSISSSTGFSPAYITQGRELRMPSTLYDAVTPGLGRATESSDNKARKLLEIYAIASRNMGKASQDQARYYNLRRREWKPELGTLVLNRSQPLSNALDGFNAKLAPKYCGPYEVINFVSPVIVKLRELHGDKIISAHLSRIKQYHS